MIGNLCRPHFLAALLGGALIAAGAAAQAGNNAVEFTSVPAAADVPRPAGTLPRIVPPVRIGIGLSGSSTVPFRVHPPGTSPGGRVPTVLPLMPPSLPTSAGGGD